MYFAENQPLQFLRRYFKYVSIKNVLKETRRRIMHMHRQL
jgi:hypothetical protein